MLVLSALVCYTNILFYFINITSFVNVATHPVRLSDGTNTSGRVELFFNGRWGTVCNKKFNEVSGQVVCRQLNFGSISRIANPGEFPAGQSDQPVWLDEVRCTGNEEWLSACPNSGYGSNDCRHNEDVAIVCSGRCRYPYMIIYCIIYMIYLLMILNLAVWQIS